MTGIIEKRLLLFTCYTIDEWKKISESILSDASYSFDTALVHFTLPSPLSRKPLRALGSLCFFLYPIWFKKRYGHVISKFRFSFSINSRNCGEAVGFKKQLHYLAKNKSFFESCTHLTYCHAKGVTKANNKSVRAWTDCLAENILRQPEIERSARDQGYACYGSLMVLKSQTFDHTSENESPLRTRLRRAFKDCSWCYMGSFYTIFLPGNHAKIMKTKIDPHNRWATETFPGRIFDQKFAFNAARYEGDLYKHFKIIEQAQINGRSLEPGIWG